MECFTGTLGKMGEVDFGLGTCEVLHMLGIGNFISILPILDVAVRTIHTLYSSSTQRGMVFEDRSSSSICSGTASIS